MAFRFQGFCRRTYKTHETSFWMPNGTRRFSARRMSNIPKSENSPGKDAFSGLGTLFFPLGSRFSLFRIRLPCILPERLRNDAVHNAFQIAQRPVPVFRIAVFAGTPAQNRSGNGLGKKLRQKIFVILIHIQFIFRRDIVDIALDNVDKIRIKKRFNPSRPMAS